MSHVQLFGGNMANEVSLEMKKGYMTVIARKLLGEYFPKKLKVEAKDDMVFKLSTVKLTQNLDYLSDYGVKPLRKNLRYMLTFQYNEEKDIVTMKLERERSTQVHTLPVTKTTNKTVKGYDNFEKDLPKSILELSEILIADLEAYTQKNIAKVVSAMESIEKKGKLLGYYKNLPEIIYHMAPGLSNSDMNNLEVSWKNYLLKKESNDRTKPMTLGSAFHAYVLTPEIFNDLFAVKNHDLSLASTEGKRLNNIQRLETVGKEILSSDDFEMIKKGAESLKGHPLTRKLMECSAETELSLFFKDENGDLTQRARLDMVCAPKNEADLDLFRHYLMECGYISEEKEFQMDDRIYVDFKFCRSIDEHDMRTDLFKRRYYRQQAHYIEAVKNSYDKGARFFLFVQIEKGGVYDVAVTRTLDNNDVGLRQRKQLITKFMNFQNNDNLWGGRYSGIVTINVPAHAEFTDIREGEEAYSGDAA